MNIYLNIETIPPVGTRPDPARVKVAKNIKKPELIAERKVAGAEDAWRRLALIPWTAQVFCCSVLAGDAEEATLLMHYDERYLLGNLQDLLNALMTSGNALRFVTYNGLSFDFPILRARAVKYGMRDLAQYMHTGRWGDDSHIDVFRQLGEEGSLDDWAFFFNLPNDNPIDGSEISTCMEAGRHNEVVRHARSRVELLRGIYKKLEYCGV